MVTKATQPSAGQRFGELLRQHRISAALSQEALAERAGVSVRAISDLERGAKNRPYLETVRLLADALDLSENERAVLARAARPESARVAAAPLGLDAMESGGHGLPNPPTQLVGRDKDIRYVVDLLHRDDVRLVTLTGPGGVGKTRLAIAVAQEVAPFFTSGVVWIDLAPVREPDLVIVAVARAVGLRDQGDQPLIDQLRNYLGDRALLLLLDNCEHVLEAMTVPAMLMAAARKVKVLATSRERLHLRGERELPVAPLAVPVSREYWQVKAPLSHLVGVAAVQLFIERAEEARHDFVFSAENAGAVAELCRHLEGLPLAIELAAARMRLLSPSALLDRLGPRLPTLTGGPRDLPGRQQTVEATISWSYELLSADEQKLFRRMSAFAGGWTLESAEAVSVGGEENRPAAIFPLLGSLAEKSLVSYLDGPTGGPRFRMLEAIREFAANQLEKSGEAEAVRCRHAAWCEKLAVDAHNRVLGPDQGMVLDQLEADSENLQLALAWALDHELELAQRLLDGIFWLWYFRNYLHVGRRWLERVLDRTDGTRTQLRASALNQAAQLALTQGHVDPAEEWGEESVAIRREFGDDQGLAYTLLTHGSSAAARGDGEQARKRYQESLALFQKTGNEWGAGTATCALGKLELKLGDGSQAATLLESGMALLRKTGDLLEAAGALSDLGYLAIVEGDENRADNLLREAIAEQRRLSSNLRAAGSLLGLGNLERRRGNNDRAESLLDEALGLYQTVDDIGGIVAALAGLGEVVLDGGNKAAAIGQFHACLATCKHYPHVVSLPSCLDGVARLLCLCARPGLAAELSGAADALRESGVAWVTSPLHVVGLPDRATREQVAVSLRTELGESKYTAAYERGRTLAPELAIRVALEAIEQLKYLTAPAR